jgi:hypothetical protein
MRTGVILAIALGAVAAETAQAQPFSESLTKYRGKQVVVAFHLIDKEGSVVMRGGVLVEIGNDYIIVQPQPNRPPSVPNAQRPQPPVDDWWNDSPMAPPFMLIPFSAIMWVAPR